MSKEESKPDAQNLFDGKQLDDVLTKATLLDRFTRSGLSVEAFAKENKMSATTLRRRIDAAKLGSRNLADKRKGRSGRKVKPIDERVFRFVLSFLEQHKRRNSSPFTPSWMRPAKPRAGRRSATQRSAG